MQLTNNFHQRKEIHNIFLPYLFILFQSEKICIKHSMQLTMTFIKEKKSKIYSYLISSFSFSLKRLALKHSMQLIITFIKEKKSIIYSYLISSFCFSLKRLALAFYAIDNNFSKKRNPKYINTLSLHFLSVWKD